MSNIPNNQDSTDIDRIHAAVKREKADLPAGTEPAPMWVIFIGLMAAIIGGGQMGNFDGYGLESTYTFASAKDPRAGSGPVVELSPLQLAMKKGEQSYAVCAGCHQGSGAGLPGMYPALAGSDWVTGGHERLVRVILQGLAGPLTVSGKPFNSSLPGGMPGQGGGMDDQAIANVATYVRNSFGNKAGLVTKEMVTKVRDAAKSRTTQWIEAELAEFAKPDPEPAAK